MTTTTADNMNILMEKPDSMVSMKIPGRFKDMIAQGAAKLKVNVSQYMKIAIAERLEKDGIKE